jgi:hypothetical protein
MQSARRLGEALEQKRCRHDRVVWKTPLKIRLVYRDVLNTRRGTIAVHLDDPVHEKERIAVRQDLEDVGGFHPPKRRSCAVRVRHRKPALIKWRACRHKRGQGPGTHGKTRR